VHVVEHDDNGALGGEVLDQRAGGRPLEIGVALDEAALAGLREVRVVHGRGTGVLRKAVREELARHPLVERTEPDAEDGATLAHLGA
jgi:dsDNA-specific endonuclease/ATPase MutS2